MQAVPLNTVSILEVPKTLDIAWYNQAVSYLDYYERQRFKHYKNHRKHTFLLGRWLLKTQLAQHIQCAPKAIKIGITHNGKPYIKAPRSARHLHISLTHSGPFIACGLVSTPHGIDIENTERAPTNPKYISQLINPYVDRHIHSLAQSTPSQLSELFILFWTYLEAQVKLKGSTLYQEKAHFFQNGLLTPRLLSAITPEFAFCSQKICSYIVSYGCWHRQSRQPIQFVIVKNTKKKSIKYDKIELRPYKNA